jgi:hypothetical protein
MEALGGNQIQLWGHPARFVCVSYADKEALDHANLATCRDRVRLLGGSVSIPLASSKTRLLDGRIHAAGIMVIVKNYIRIKENMPEQYCEFVM